MFALKNINLGDELTFDYCSMTEDQSEYKKAYCLCGTTFCRGKYLDFLKSKKGMEIVEKEHNFLDRNNILL
jgi:[histone H3]-lysine4 N-trimethyltransferase ATXR3